MPLILLLTMIAIFFYYNAQENIKGFYKTRGFQGKVQITGIGWADKITYRMNKEDEVKHYLIFHIDYQETINNKKEHVKTQLPLHIQDLLYPYIASPTESDSDFNRQNSEYKRTKNVPWYILAPAAVACDTYLVRRSAHPERSVFYILEKDFPNI